MAEHLPAKLADVAMFKAEPHDNYDPRSGVMPKVSLLWMTPDPLGAVAAMSEMYKGNVVRDLSEVTDDMRRSAWADMQNTHLTAPLEAIKLHFMLDGVDRAFTHQLVRQRTAAYAQESMRFAVVDNLRENSSLPPSLMGVKEDDPKRVLWDQALDSLGATYQRLVAAGMPAEDARGLLPHCVATRTNYVTDLRSLLDHAGNRLCTQAQFTWRFVFNGIVKAIRECGMGTPMEWQFREIADSSFFRPVCYQLGKCPWKASFDRACSIRDRVDANQSIARPSSEWHEDYSTYDGQGNSSVAVPGIHVREWLLDPSAARVGEE